MKSTLLPWAWLKSTVIYSLVAHRYDCTGQVYNGELLYPRCSLARSRASWSCSAVPLRCRRSRCTWPALCPPVEDPCTVSSPSCWAASWLMWPCLLLWSTWTNRAHRTGGREHLEGSRSSYNMCSINPLQEEIHTSSTFTANQIQAVCTFRRFPPARTTLCKHLRPVVMVTALVKCCITTSRHIKTCQGFKAIIVRGLKKKRTYL